MNLKIFILILFLLFLIQNFYPCLAETWEEFADKGKSLVEAGSYAEAIIYLDKALEINPLDTDSLTYKGLALYNQGKYREAIEFFDMALKINPDLNKTYLYRQEAALSAMLEEAGSLTPLPENPTTPVPEHPSNMPVDIGIKIIEPEELYSPDFKWEGSTLHITGIAISDNAIAKVLIDGKEATVSNVREEYIPYVPSEGSAVQFEGEALLSLGNNKISIIAVDKSGEREEELFSAYREEDTVVASGTPGEISVEIKKPLIPAEEEPWKTTEGRITVEGLVKADTGIGAFEIYTYTGNNENNPDWREKGPHATGKKSYFFSQEVELKAGLNHIVVRIVDSTGKEIIKEIEVVYTPGEGEKWAVVIGIGKYQNPSVGELKYSAQDAQNVYDYLITEGGFPQGNVMLLLNEKATLVEIKTALGKFLQEKAGKDDLVFIYYSGHGAPEINPRSNDGDGLTKYIVTYDADPDNLFATALPMDDINTIFERILAKKIVFFIDSCYSGASGGKTFAAGDVKTGNISDNFLNQISKGSGRLVITASSANEVALESDSLGHGIFTYYLIEGLKGAADTNKNTFVTVDEVYSYIYENVTEESKNKQHPVKKGEVEGEIILGNTRSQ